MRKKKLSPIILAACLASFSMTGCQSGENGGEISDTLAGSKEESSIVAEGQTDSGTAEDLVAVSDMFTDRDMEGSYDQAEDIVLSEGDVTITQEGVYHISGVLKDGMIIVDAQDTAKVQLVFDGVQIDNDTNAAVYVKQADKVFLTLADNSENSLTSGGYTSLDDNNIDGVIFAKSDLTINGGGSLTINAKEGHGIVSKDDLKITGGVINVTAAGHGLSGKDSVRVGGGTLQITSEGDGIHAENNDDSEKGFVYLADGTINIISKGDGISAGSVFQIDGGVMDIAAGGGSANGTVSTDENGEEVSTKGLKSSGAMLICQAVVSIDSQDDAIHSDSDVVIAGGEFTLVTGDDGIHGDTLAKITGGSIEIPASYEGIEGGRVEISGGEISLYAADDGLNAGGGRDQSGFGGRFGGNFGGAEFGGRGAAFEDSGSTAPAADAGQNSETAILISGGTILVRADGDGVDSNGTLTVTGGDLRVSGPEDGANGSLDFESAGQITGGTVVAAGNRSMAMNFGDTSTQGSVMITTFDHTEGTVVTLEDAEGTELLSYTPECAFNCVVISCPELKLGETYIVKAGGESTEVTLSDSLIYGNGTGFGGGGFGGGAMMPDGGMHGGRMQEGAQSPEDGGMRPEGMEPPEDGGMMPEGAQPSEDGGAGTGRQVEY